MSFIPTDSLPDDLFSPSTGAPPGLHFRLARVSDRADLQAVCYPERSPRQFRDHFEQMMNWQQNGRACWLIIEQEVRKTNAEARRRGEGRGCQLVGSGQLLIYPHSAELANLVVSPARRGQGIGTAMITIFLRIAQHLKLPALEIGVAADNPRALALYQRLGFEEDRQVRMFNGETAVILRQEIVN